MLEFRELSRQLADCSQGRLSLGDFEDWFVRNSWNAHQSQDDNLVDAVFEIEELLSAEADARIDNARLLRRFEELASRIDGGCLPLKTGSISSPQQITIQWEPSYEVPPQVTSTSVSAPEMLELLHA